MPIVVISLRGEPGRNHMLGLVVSERGTDAFRRQGRLHHRRCDRFRSGLRRAFVAEGAVAVIADIDDHQAAETVAELQAGGATVIAVHCDVGQRGTG
jgi:hypothetical protein